jgi:hypothetical protein
MIPREINRGWDSNLGKQSAFVIAEKLLGEKSTTFNRFNISRSR